MSERQSPDKADVNKAMMYWHERAMAAERTRDELVEALRSRPMPAEKSVRECARELISHVESAESGYIPGCGNDLSWRARRDELVADLRLALDNPELPMAELSDETEKRLTVLRGELLQTLTCVGGVAGLDTYKAQEILRCAFRLGAAGREEVELQWRCFHCNEVFTSHDEALEHFGPTQLSDPGCAIDIKAYREMEEINRRHGEEDTDLHRQLAVAESEHSVALRREEEAGYAKGLKDYTALESRLARVTEAARALRMKLLDELGVTGPYIAMQREIDAVDAALSDAPDDRVLAPREPTEAMIAAGWDVEELKTPERIYRAMLTASEPKP